MSSFGLRISLFVLMAVGYFLFLIALAERFVLSPSSESLPASKPSQPSSAYSYPTMVSYPSFAREEVEEAFNDLSYKDVISSSAFSEGIEICANDADCYTYYPGITTKWSMVGNLESTLTRRTLYIIRSVSLWAWDVLSRTPRPQGSIKSQRRKHFGIMHAKWTGWATRGSAKSTTSYGVWDHHIHIVFSWLSAEYGFVVSFWFIPFHHGFRLQHQGL